MKAGLTSDRLRRVCRAVRNESRVSGEFVGGVTAPGKRDCRGVAVDDPLARATVCLKDEKPLLDGGGEWPGLGGDTGIPPPGEERPMVVAFFFPVNDRKIDHSDSNWTASPPASTEE